MVLLGPRDFQNLDLWAKLPSASTMLAAQNVDFLSSISKTSQPASQSGCWLIESELQDAHDFCTALARRLTNTRLGST